MICGGCGAEVDEIAIYCVECGVFLKGKSGSTMISERHSPISVSEIRRSSTHSTVSRRRASKNEQTSAFPTMQPKLIISRVIKFNYIIMGVLVVVLLILIRYASSTALILGLLAIFIFWINDGLKKYDNFRKNVYLFVLGFSFLLSLFYSAPLAVFLGVYSAIIFFVLMSHPPTMRLFQK